MSSDAQNLKGEHLPSERVFLQTLKGANELAPEGLALTVAHLEPQQLPAAMRVHPHGDDHGSGADPQGLAQPAMEVGGIEVDVGVAGLLQGPVLLRRRLRLLVPRVKCSL